MPIGPVLKKAREGRRLSQEDLAKMMKVSKAAVSKWESEKTTPSRRRIADLAYALGLPVDELRDLADHRSNGGMTVQTDSPQPSRPNEPDLYVRRVDPGTMRFQTVETPRDVPVLGTNPRGRAGDFEMGEETGAFVRRPPALLGRADIRAFYTNNGDLLFLETMRPPRPGDTVVAVMKAAAGWAPAYMRTLISLSGAKIILQGIELEAAKVDLVYRVMSMADLFA